MLVLTRRVGESIVIGEGVSVTVVAIGNGRVKLGITAPKDMPVHRSEVHDRIKLEQAAAGIDPQAVCK